jgi:hypothetical protein
MAVETTISVIDVTRLHVAIAVVPTAAQARWLGGGSARLAGLIRAAGIAALVPIVVMGSLWGGTCATPSLCGQR